MSEKTNPILSSPDQGETLKTYPRMESIQLRFLAQKQLGNAAYDSKRINLAVNSKDAKQIVEHPFINFQDITKASHQESKESWGSTEYDAAYREWSESMQKQTQADPQKSEFLLKLLGKPDGTKTISPNDIDDLYKMTIGDPSLMQKYQDSILELCKDEAGNVSNTKFQEQKDHISWLTRKLYGTDTVGIILTEVIDAVSRIQDKTTKDEFEKAYEPKNETIPSRLNTPSDVEKQKLDEFVRLLGLVQLEEQTDLPKPPVEPPPPAPSDSLSETKQKQTTELEIVKEMTEGKSWAEIREAWRTKPYWEIYESLLPSLKGADSTIPDTPENKQLIADQINKANTKQCVQCFPNAKTTPLEKNGRKLVSVKNSRGNAVQIENKPDYKLIIMGDNEPKMIPYQDTLTRIYISLDPRKATDAFYTLTKDLAEKGILSDMQMALVTEETSYAEVVPNSAVIYVTKSQLPERQKILDTILHTYQVTKQKNPELFTLEPKHQKANRAHFLPSYRCFIDDNMSFVEMNSSSSYDASGRQEIDDALGVSYLDDKGGINHTNRINRLQSQVDGVVWKPKAKPDPAKMDTYPEGTRFQIIRNLSCPALIQYDERVIRKKEGQTFLEPPKVTTEPPVTEKPEDSSVLKIPIIVDFAEYKIPDPHSAIRTINPPSVVIEAEEKLSPEEQKFRKFVNDGADLIRKGEFGKAISFFKNQDAQKMANSFGCYLTEARSYFLDNKPLSKKEIHEIANWIAYMSQYNLQSKSINIARAIAVDRSVDPVKPFPLPKELEHENALVALEEWLHALQHFHNGPLAGYEDGELDIAAYMQKHGVPVTPTFMARYDRDKILLGKEQDISSLRRGTFVKVKRSDGTIEDGWQIVGFDAAKNCVNTSHVRQQIKKQVLLENLADLNPTENLPFAKTHSLSELFTVIDQLQGVYGYQDYFTAQQLKQTITDISQGKNTLEAIPRSGGLRLKVKEILKI